MDQQIIAGYRNLVLAVTRRPDDEDFLPLRDGDIEAIKESVFYLSDEYLDGGSRRLFTDIITMRFGLDGKGVRTQKEIGHILGGVSAARIGYLEKRAMKRLRHPRSYFNRLFRSGLESEADNWARDYRNLQFETQRKVSEITEKLYKERREYRLGGRSNDAVHISELNLSVRVSNCLTVHGINTLWKLMHKTKADLFAIKNFGICSLHNVEAKLAKFGYSLSREGD